MNKIDEIIILDKENPIRFSDFKNREILIRSEREGYIFSCSQGLSLVSAAIEKTKISLNILETSYTKKTVEQTFNTTIDEYIEYSIENYFIRSSGIYDRCLGFAAKLHNLGLSPESINHDLIVTNEHVKKSGISNNLKALRKVCMEYRIERNKVVHHGRYSEEIFNYIAVMHKVNYSDSILGQELTFTEKDIELFTNEFLEIQVQEFQEHLEKVLKEVNKFFDKSVGVYVQYKSKLEKKV